ncbi:MAG TPA: hypothetical protein PKZ53_18585 [Acidobacteriota bacterium]|nr:hypothetical protein [Acidobacteriota bacterium]
MLGICDFSDEKVTSGCEREVGGRFSQLDGVGGSKPMSWLYSCSDKYLRGVCVVHTLETIEESEFPFCVFRMFRGSLPEILYLIGPNAPSVSSS